MLVKRATESWIHPCLCTGHQRTFFNQSENRKFPKQIPLSSYALFHTVTSFYAPVLTVEGRLGSGLVRMAYESLLVRTEIKWWWWTSTKVIPTCIQFILKAKFMLMHAVSFISIYLNGIFRLRVIPLIAQINFLQYNFRINNVNPISWWRNVFLLFTNILNVTVLIESLKIW